MKTRRERREQMGAILHMKSTTEGLRNYINAICDDANLCEDAIVALRAFMAEHEAEMVIERMSEDLQRALAGSHGKSATVV